MAAFLGNPCTVPVEIDDASNVVGAFLKIKYDTSMLALQSVKSGSLISNISPTVNSANGVVSIAVSQETSLSSGKGSLAELEFIPAVSVPDGTTTAIQIIEAQLNDGAIPAITQNGAITFFAKAYRWG